LFSSFTGYSEDLFAMFKEQGTENKNFINNKIVFIKEKTTAK
jgi:hypothetical protein